MDQLTLKFPFSKKYFEHDFFVSTNNFSAYKLIEGLAKLARQMFKYFWCLWFWQNSFNKNFRKKIDKVKIIDAKKLNDDKLKDINNIDCLIIDSFDNNIDEKLFYSILNQIKQLDNYILINSIYNLKNINFKLEDSVKN